MVISDPVSHCSFIFTWLIFWDISSSVNDTFEVLFMLPHVFTMFIYILFFFHFFVFTMNSFVSNPITFVAFFVLEKKLLFLKCLPRQLWQVTVASIRHWVGSTVFFECFACSWKRSLVFFLKWSDIMHIWNVSFLNSCNIEFYIYNALMLHFQFSKNPWPYFCRFCGYYFGDVGIMLVFHW